MSRKTKYVAKPEAILHAYNRGLNRSQIFFREEDYEQFLAFVANALRAAEVSLLAFTLMPNHFHLVMRQFRAYAISRFMQEVSQRFVRRMNSRLARTGHLFDGRFKVGFVPDAPSLLRMSRYVHMNPVGAKLVKEPGDWKFSSSRAYAAGIKSCLSDSDLILSLVGGVDGYERFLREYDPSNPESAERFILPGKAEKWLEKP